MGTCTPQCAGTCTLRCASMYVADQVVLSEWQNFEQADSPDLYTSILQVEDADFP